MTTHSYRSPQLQAETVRVWPRFLTVTGITLASALLPAAAVGCSAKQGDGVATSSNDLSALSGAEIVGSIAYGQSVGPISYTENPRYRALSFQGNRGDDVRITASGTGVPAVWLLGPDFATITSATAEVSARSITISTSLPAAQTYYIAFREADQEDAQFTVSLSASSGPNPPPPPPQGNPADPFDPASCSGPTASVGELESWLMPGETSTPLGSGALTVQTRSCVTRSTGPDCSDWATQSGSGETVALTLTQANDGATVTFHGAQDWAAVNVTSSGVSATTTSIAFNALPTLPSGSTGGVVTDHCFRIPVPGTGRANNEVSWTESRGAIVAQFQSKPNRPVIPPPVNDPNDPFAPASCQGPTVTVGELEDHFAHGQVSTSLPNGSLSVQTRTCAIRSSGADCQPWVMQPNSGETVAFTLNQENDGVGVTFHGAHDWAAVNVTSSGVSATTTSIAFNALPTLPSGSSGAVMTPSCFRLPIPGAGRSGTNVSWTESRGVILGRY
jgi:hypothetical protein